MEFIESIEPILLKIISKKKELNIIDFGCGKAYLSFALYYYLNEIKHIPSQIYGLDLKKDVIEFCNNLAQTCNFSNLNFKTGDIGNFKFNTEPDMVISLHACDTATDFALAKAVKSNAKIIFAVPCCQHELNTQIRQNKQKIRQSAFFSSLLDYGIITEKFSSLLTDTLRAKYLEASGYKVNIEEFIDTEHTPKNILIKAVKINTIKSEIIEKSKREIAEIIKTFSLTPVLEKLL
ncbi:class I SAM-dependent methyltransferase [Treponema pedis]|uniref:class I SAM-dependent methyltransferase n=1 Tax=Treponema pedis TaxID=409322 RepID=UPI0020909BBD|nr:SAM-dependent methyltransferase [Treponema pedis]